VKHEIHVPYRFCYVIRGMIHWFVTTKLYRYAPFEKHDVTYNLTENLRVVEQASLYKKSIY